MQRLRLGIYRQIPLTPDTIQATRELTAEAHRDQWDLDIFGPLQVPSQDHDLIAAGREVHMRLRSRNHDDQTGLNLLWERAERHGFTPWLRYPASGDQAAYTFHYLGPWQAMLARLQAEVGPSAWQSVCVATRCDVGAWRRDRELERFAQAQLHRLGYSCGPVNGILSPRVLAVLTQVGLDGLPLVEVVERLRS